ncbi:MAG: AraC family transcriptional regulator [Kiritimatiellae bacterium]|nr:AraC family transcriptional regulator [Kiritimatiellia bacterium]
MRRGKSNIEETLAADTRVPDGSGGFRVSYAARRGAGLPFFIYSTGRLATIETHDHDFWEVVYVYEGRGTCTVGKQAIAFHSRQLILTPPFVPHRFEACAGSLHRQVSLAVYPPVLRQIPFLQSSVDDLLAWVAEGSRYAVAVPEGVAEEFERRIEAIQREFLLKPRGYEASIALDLGQLMVHAARLYRGDTDAFPQVGDCPLVVRQALAAIHTSYATIRGLRGIVPGIRIDQRYFIRLFKKHVGHTPVNYLNRIRIERSGELLLHTRQPVAQIAFDTGYNDLRHFNRQFRRIMGATPTAYREQRGAARSHRSRAVVSVLRKNDHGDDDCG